MRKLALIVCGLLLMASAATAQVTSQVNASWTAPTEGSPVHHYVLQLSTDGGPFVTVLSEVIGTSVNLDLEINRTYVARVAGVDDQARQGPYSPDSDPYILDLGPPGAPGKPLIVEG